MSDGKIPMTITGNLCADPELRFTPNGVAVARFTVASTPRVFDKQAQEWKDGAPLFMRCTAWRELAENTAESLSKGARVVVTGLLRQRTWTDDEQRKHTVYELDAEEVAASLRFAQATIRRIARDRSAAA